jgi:hypothetical protein
MAAVSRDEGVEGTLASVAVEERITVQDVLQHFTRRPSSSSRGSGTVLASWLPSGAAVQRQLSPTKLIMYLLEFYVEDRSPTRNAGVPQAVAHRQTIEISVENK